MERSSIRNYVEAYRSFNHIMLFIAVVCPVSIVGQWANEVKSKLAANLSIYMYHGSKRQDFLSTLLFIKEANRNARAFIISFCPHTRIPLTEFCFPFQDTRSKEAIKV
jgi:hypothetical protein